MTAVAQPTSTRSPARRSALRPTVESLVAAVASQGGLVISGVFAARLLGPQDRGYLALVMLIPLALTYAGGLGLPLAATYYIARQRGTAAAIARRLRPVLAIQALVLMALQAVAVALLLPGSRLAAGLVALVWTPAVLVYQLALGILQGRQRFRAFNVVRVVPVFFYALGVAALYAIHYQDVAAVAAAWTLAYVLGGAIALAAALHNIEHDPEAKPPTVGEMTRFGCRGLLGSTSPIEAFRIDQAFVGLALSPTALGYYVVAYAFTNFPRIASQSIGMIAYPAVADVNDPQAARRLGARFLRFNFLVCGAVVAGLAIVTPYLLPRIYGHDFSAAVTTSQVLLASAWFLSMRRVLSDVLRGRGRPLVGTVAELVSWFALVPSILTLAPAYGTVGAATAVLIASVCSVGVLLAATLGWRAPRPFRGATTSEVAS